MKRAFLVVEEVAELLRCTPRSVHGLTAASRIPHRRLAGHRRLLFVPDEIEAWANGAALEVVETADGGRIVRPKGAT